MNPLIHHAPAAGDPGWWTWEVTGDRYNDTIGALLVRPDGAGRARCRFTPGERQRNIARWLETGLAQPGSGVGHYVRSYLLEVQGSACAICGCPTTWQGQELRLVLDHADGDASNNQRANLRLVCPNCDSQ